MVATVSDNAEPTLYPRSEIPVSLICPLCVDATKSFANELSYRGHMRMKHNIAYERMPESERNGMSVEQLKGLPDTLELTTLKPYMQLAIARHELYGFSWEEIADDMGRSAQHLSKCARSPAGQAYIASLGDIMGDTKAVVKMLIESAQLGMYADWMAALEMAKGARDYKAIHTMMKDVGLQPMLAETQRDAGPRTIVINVDGGAAARIDALPEGTSTWRLADDAKEAEFTVED